MRSLLTVSELALRGDAAERAMRHWIAETAGYNAANGLTGGLIIARNLLADIVEGEPLPIEASLRRARDACHQIHLVTVDSLTIARRAFRGWTLLYQGCATYVAGPIAALLEEQDAFHSHRMRRLMEAFADPSTRPPGATERKALGADWPGERKARLVPTTGR